MSGGFAGVADTLYIPLAARIYVSERFPEYFRDDAALALKGKVPDGAGGRSSEYAMMASVARYHNADAMERDFVERNGRCNIVHLGVGLETAYLRLSELDAHFYDVDLPEVIELRRRLLPVSENETLIAGDLFDMGWADEVDASLPTMILVLGVFQYFTEDRVAGAVKRMRGMFPVAELVFDATSTKGLRYANRYVEKTGNKSARMHFAVDDAREFAEKTGTGLEECRNFFEDARRMLGKKLGIYTRVAMRVVDRNGHTKIVRLRLRPTACRRPCAREVVRIGTVVLNTSMPLVE